MRGNYIADALAGLGASRHAAAPADVQSVEVADQLASLLLRRFAAITLSLIHISEPTRLALI
eukprot:7500399-Alexandrium_andersonii.AAC.1